MAAVGIYARELQRVRAQFRKKSGGGLKATGSSMPKASTGKAVGPDIAVSELPEIEVPRILEEATRFLVSFSQALADQIRYRVSVLGMSEHGTAIPNFYTSGGMWRGLEVRAKMGKATIAFMKSSYSSSKSGPNPALMEGMSRREKTAFRKRHKFKKARNRDKAKTVQFDHLIHDGIDLLGPTTQEIEDTLRWFQKVFDESLLKE